jgi:hypothetical protein
VPFTAVRLARDFRPLKMRCTFTKRSDGLYNEPYSAIVEREDEVSVLCVQRTAHRQVLVRYMPEREWQRIVQYGEEVYPGHEGESSLHVVAPPEMSLLPRCVQAEVTALSRDNGNTLSNGWVLPSSPAAADATSAVPATYEPAVFDYFVAPESRIERVRRSNKSYAFTTLGLHARYNKAELQRVAREDCRAALAVERRRIFLRQYQRDMQYRMTGVALYTVGKELPEQFVQTFFLQVENAQALRRHQARLEMNRVGARTTQQQQQRQQRSGDRSGNPTGGRYLFTLDQAFMSSGERMPFAGQAPADGMVVVTVGPTADAFSAAWRPWSVAGRFSWTDEDEDNNKPFVPVEYSSSQYTPLTIQTTMKNNSLVMEGATATTEERNIHNRLQGSSPLLPRYPTPTALKKVSSLSSDMATPLGMSRSSSSPFDVMHTSGASRVLVKPHSSLSGMDECGNSTRTPSLLRVPVSSDEGKDENSMDVAVMPPQLSVQVV